MSHTSGKPLPPAASISLAAVNTVPSSFGCGSAVFAAIATFAPSRAARIPIARPIPRLAPVMNRVFPRRDMGGNYPGLRSHATAAPGSELRHDLAHLDVLVVSAGP